MIAQLEFWFNSWTLTWKLIIWVFSFIQCAMYWSINKTNFTKAKLYFFFFFFFQVFDKQKLNRKIPTMRMRCVVNLECYSAFWDSWREREIVGTVGLAKLMCQICKRLIKIQKFRFYIIYINNTVYIRNRWILKIDRLVRCNTRNITSLFFTIC